LLRTFERAYVGELLKMAGGNISEAARLGQVDRKHLWRILQRTGIRVERAPGARSANPRFRRAS